MERAWMHDDGGKAAAEALASELWFRSIDALGAVVRFRQMANIGLPQATAVTARECEALCREFAESDEYADMFFVDRQELIKRGYFDQAAKTMIERAVKAFDASVDAASLIFAHSLLDGAAMDWCRVCSLAKPTDFIQAVGQKKVSIIDVQKNSWPDLLKRAISDHLSTLEKESLPKKLDLLFSLCKPPPGFVGVDGYSYDRSRVAALDALRHRYAHGGYPAERLPNGDGDVLFLLQTNAYLMLLVHHGYGIRIDPNAISNIKQVNN
jgi:hypothetical protein